MIKTTDLNTIKDIAISFLCLPVGETPLSPLIVDHPIFETGVIGLKINGEIQNINIMTEDGFELAIKEYRKLINSCEKLIQIYLFIRKSYKLTFLKFIKQFLSLKDFSNLLSEAWVTSENPNQDKNCSLALITKWFKAADKSILMNDEEYTVYIGLPDEFEVYRGVAVGRNPKGLSWTKSYDKALWFANRFNHDGKIGFVQKGIAKKENVLAYFNRRNEDEIVVNIKDLKDVEIVTEKCKEEF